MKTFEPGEIYFGTLTCAHSDFPVRCIKRTDKSVWFEHINSPHYPLRRAKLHKYDDQECAMFYRWYISSTKRTGGDFDPLTI
jgi:hypothetical protein